MKKTTNGKVIENYNEIMPIPKKHNFRLFPGAYCKNCGETFALYSYSMFQPNGIDENGKAFYNKCGVNGCA